MRRFVPLIFGFLVTFHALTGCVSTSILPASGEPKNRAETLEWVKEITLGSEYSPSEQIISRWTRWSATVSAHGANRSEQALVQNVTEELNTILKGTGFSLKLKKPDTKDPAIKVIFAPKKNFPKIASEHGFSYVKGNIGFFYYWTNGQNEIFKAVVLIDSGLDTKMKNHVTHEEMVQALGLANDSKRSASSVFFERRGDGGKAQNYSTLDQKLIYFVYKHLKAGAGPQALETAFEKHWKD